MANAVANKWKVVWITGASTGIGRELALKLAARGTDVAVSARSADKLIELQALNPRIRAYPLDVADLGAVRATAEAIARDLGPIDLAVLNAGTWDAMGAKDFDATRVAHTMSVNFQGAVNGVDALARPFIARHAGHIALVASVAGYRGMPKAAAYGPSKSALIALGEALRTDFAKHGVIISVINPGFVETPMTAVNKFPMPFMISADDAANRIIRGLESGRFEIVFPRRMMLMMKILRALPYGAYFYVARTMLTPKKRA